MSRSMFFARYGSGKHLDQLFGEHPLARREDSIESVGELQLEALNNVNLSRHHLDIALRSESPDVRAYAMHHPMTTESDMIRRMSDPVHWVSYEALQAHNIKMMQKK